VPAPVRSLHTLQPLSRYVTVLPRNPQVCYAEPKASMNVRLHLVRSSRSHVGSLRASGPATSSTLLLASMTAISACTNSPCPNESRHCASSDTRPSDEQSSPFTTAPSEDQTSDAEPSNNGASSNPALTSSPLTSDTHPPPFPDDSSEPEAHTCDPRQVTCRLQPPPCDFGFVPGVKDGCYSECVPVDECVCDEADACPDRDRYTCNLSRQRCTPYLN
jgi:hypothetical protein